MSLKSESAVRRSVRVKVPSLKAREENFRILLQDLWATIDKTVEASKHTHKRVVDEKCCDEQLLEQNEVSLKRVIDKYNAIRSDVLFTADEHSDLRVAVDRLKHDLSFLSEKIRSQILPASAINTHKECVGRPSHHESGSHKSAQSVSSISSSKSRATSGKYSRTSSLKLRLAATESALKAARLETELKKKELEMRQLELELRTAMEEKEILQEEAKEASELLSPRPSLAQKAATPSVGHKSNASSCSSVEVLAKTIADSLALNNLPAAGPDVFSGDPLEYADWEASFEADIESRCRTEQDKMRYLKRYLAGPAKEAVSGFFIFRGPGCYREARKVLEERFGDRFAIAEAFRSTFQDFPNVHDGAGLRRLSDKINQCLGAMKTMTTLDIMNDHREIHKIVQKTPQWLQRKWLRVSVNSRKEKGRYPNFVEFGQFLKDEADVLCEEVQMQQIGWEPKAQKGLKPKRVLATTAVQKHGCFFCKKPNHAVSECFSLMSRSTEERMKLARREKLCFRCFMSGHSAQNCKKEVKCKKCNGNHVTVMHGIERREQAVNNAAPEPTREESVNPQTPSENSSAICNAYTSSTDQGRSSMAVPVWVSCGTSKEKLVYALLDTQSDTSFLLNDVADELGVRHKTSMLSLSTMTAKKQIQPCRIYEDLAVRGYNSEKKVVVRKAYGRDFIPWNKDEIATRTMAFKWEHLRPLQNDLPELKGIEVGLLIGCDCPKALAPEESLIHPREDEAPYGVKTSLGWSIVGSVSSGKYPGRLNHRLVTRELSPLEAVKALEPDLQVQAEGKYPYSQEDLMFLTMMQEGIIQGEDGHYSMPLPLKGRPRMPDNRSMAESRLTLLQKKFQKNSNFKEQYFNLMEETLQRGDAEVVPEQTPSDGQVNYIPHFGVMHPKKHKLRIVFDCAAKCNAVSINDYLLSGPDQLNKLIGVLLRFRKEDVAVMCDIEKMFHQFRVSMQDRDYLRFLWYTDRSMTLVREYRMTVHLFGATSSPGCATYGLRQVARDHCNPENLHSRLAAEFIEHNFYVDDGILSIATPAEACRVVAEARNICAKGNLRLHKFASNSKEVLESVPASERAETTSNLDLAIDQLPVERALGVQWYLENDSLGFKVCLDNKPVTRRGILSTIASIYDPLGLLAPFILKGKRILQGVCKNGSTWGEPVSSETESQWLAWKDQIQELSSLQIPRCVKPKQFGTVQKLELHHFADASMGGYGMCSYVRLVNDTGSVHCTLVFAKSRVPSLKPTTIPRAELQAAANLASCATFLSHELQWKDASHFFWTDSQVVLGYIRNEARRFHVFVANRIQQIHDHTNPTQWNHIKSAENPADIASRGADIQELAQSVWYKGPDFLWNADPISPSDDEFEVNMNDPELKKARATKVIENSAYDSVKKISAWKKAVGVVRLLLKFTNRVPASEVELNRKAQNIIIYWCQSEHIDNRKSLAGLNPYVDNNGLLRVGGRLKHAAGEVNPVILPRRSHVTQLIIEHYHRVTGHSGKGIAMSKIRDNGFWIVGCGAAVSSFIQKCITCRKLRGTLMHQQMADLPKERTEPTPPFTNVGCDCFGPFEVKDGRRHCKRWGVVFTCMASRAVHIELVDDLSADSFINAIRNVIALRGPIRKLFCDRGTNFVGANTELQKALSEMPESLKTYLLRQNCEFAFNPPAASHMGGVWERQIRTIRNILSGLLSDSHHKMESSSLRTLFYEVAAIINGRPLCVESINDPLGPESLTPNQLLTQKTDSILPPPGEFTSADEYAKKRWRRVQHLANRFWKRWRSEYLNSLQPRRKWTQPTSNVEKGDIVLLADDNEMRNVWRPGRVVDVQKSEDGLVRKVQVLVGDRTLDDHGRRTRKACILERSIHKLKLLIRNVGE